MEKKENGKKRNTENRGEKGKPRKMGISTNTEETGNTKKGDM